MSARAVYWALLIYLGLGPLVVVPVAGVGRIGIPDLLLPVAVGIVVLAGGRSVPIVSWFYLGFLFVAALSATIHLHTTGDVKPAIQAIRLVSIFLPFLVVFRLPSLDDRRLAQMVTVVLVSGAVAILVGLGLHYAGIQIRDNQQRLWLGNNQGTVLRAGGLIGNTGGFGHLVAVWGLGAVLLTQLTPRRQGTVIALLGLGIALWAIVLSASRGSFLHLLVGLAVGLPILIKQNRSVRFALLSLPIAVFALSTFGSSILPRSAPEPLRQSWLRLDILNLSGESEFFQTVRLANWAEIVGSIDQSPALGSGLGVFTAESGRYVDNGFIAAFVETGIGGGTLYAAFWIVLSVQFASWAFKGSPFGLAGLALTISEIVHTTNVDTFRLWYSSPLLFVLLAVCYRKASSGEGDESS